MWNLYLIYTLKQTIANLSLRSFVMLLGPVLCPVFVFIIHHRMTRKAPQTALYVLVVVVSSRPTLLNSALLRISAVDYICIQVYSFSFRFYYFASDVLYDIKLVNLFWRLFYLLQLVARTSAQYHNVVQLLQSIYNARYITCGIYYGKNNNSSSSLLSHIMMGVYRVECTYSLI